MHRPLSRLTQRMCRRWVGVGLALSLGTPRSLTRTAQLESCPFTPFTPHSHHHIHTHSHLRIHTHSNHHVTPIHTSTFKVRTEVRHHRSRPTNVGHVCIQHGRRPGAPIGPEEARQKQNFPLQPGRSSALAPAGWSELKRNDVVSNIKSIWCVHASASGSEPNPNGGAGPPHFLPADRRG